MIDYRPPQPKPQAAPAPTPPPAPELPSLREIRHRQAVELASRLGTECAKLEHDHQHKTSVRRDALEGERRRLSESPAQAEPVRSRNETERERRQASLSKAETLTSGLRQTLSEREKSQGVTIAQVPAEKIRAEKLRDQARKLLADADRIVENGRPVEEAQAQLEIAEHAESNARANLEAHEKRAAEELARAVADDEGRAGRLAAIDSELGELGSREEWKARINELRRRRDIAQGLAREGEYKIIDLPPWASETP